MAKRTPPSGTVEVLGHARAVKHPHLAPFRLLPTAPGVCPECARDHQPGQPHDAQSLTYQYDFYGKHGRWPTWVDAMAHCSDAMREIWTRALVAAGHMEPPA